MHAPHRLEHTDAVFRGHFTTADGLNLQARGWRADDPRAALVLVHGYAEHSARYEHIGTYLARRGYDVYTFDLRGHGRSEGRAVFFPSFDTYVEDLALFMGHVRTFAPDRSLFLMGHSMGGAIATLYALSNFEPRPDGLILSSPMLRLSNEPSPLIMTLATWLSRFVPTLPAGRLDRMAISRDPQVVAEALSDPLNYHGRVPLRTGAELVRATRLIQDHIEHLTLPLLIFHGTADTITDPDASRACYARAGSNDKTLALFPDLYHETLNEPEQAEVLEELTEWLDEHV